MEILVIILCIFLTITTGILIYIILKKNSSLQQTKTDPILMEWIKSMHETLQNTNQQMHHTLQQNTANMTHVLQQNSQHFNQRLDKAALTLSDVNREIGKMSEIGRNMQELQEFLKSPKLRGTLGEQVLTDLIAQTFPKNSFSLQFQFKSGEKVDAAIRTDAGILPIDAKFPMENFQKMTKAQKSEDKQTYNKDFIRDIKRHIDTIAKKYILPDEGTMDFALMYIPSESVFYEIVQQTELMDYARNKRVYAVSPTTLYAHLQTILLSFEGKKIEQQARDVLKLLRALKVDYGKINENLDILGKHLNNASGQYHMVSKNFTALGTKLDTVTMLEENTEETQSEKELR